MALFLGDYAFPSAELMVGASAQIDSEDLSGETSNTDSAHKGIKPKVVNVSFLVRFTDSRLLTEFSNIVQAVNDNGELVIYNITNKTANALNIRQVRFSGNFRTKEDAELQGWRVSCSLSEFVSVPEKKENRLSAIAAPGDTATAEQTAEAQAQKTLSTFEKLLKKVDSALS